MRLAEVYQLLAGGPGSGCNPEAGQCGRKPGGASDRVTRALMNYKPFTPEKMRIASDAEARVAKVIGGKVVGSTNEGVVKGTDKRASRSAFDVLVPKNRIAVEVKTLIDPTAKDKITMRKETLERKNQYAREAKLKKTFTVVLDVRNPAKPIVYWRQGLGSFRLSGMNKVAKIDHLKGLIQ